MFEDWSDLNYLFTLLGHYESVESSEQTRKIIEDFMPVYIDFINEIIYSKHFYEMHVYLRDNVELEHDQKRIIDVAIRDFERN